jgi:hypothetical protein
MSKVSRKHARKIRQIIRRLRALQTVVKAVMQPYEDISAKWAAAEIDAMTSDSGSYLAPAPENTEKVNRALAAAHNFIEHLEVLAADAEHKLEEKLAGQRSE